MIMNTILFQKISNLEGDQPNRELTIFSQPPIDIAVAKQLTDINCIDRSKNDAYLCLIRVRYSAHSLIALKGNNLP